MVLDFTFKETGSSSVLSPFTTFNLSSASSLTTLTIYATTRVQSYRFPANVVLFHRAAFPHSDQRPKPFCSHIFHMVNSSLSFNTPSVLAQGFQLTSTQQLECLS